MVGDVQGDSESFFRAVIECVRDTNTLAPHRGDDKGETNLLPFPSRIEREGNRLRDLHNAKVLQFVPHLLNGTNFS